MLGHQFLWRNEALSARITRITNVLLVSQFFTGQPNFVCIDYDHVIAAVYVWGVRWLVFPADHFRNLRGQAPQNLALSVNNNPLFIDGAFVGRDSFVT